MIHFLFIDAAVDNIAILQAYIKPGTIVHKISKDIDGVEYITQTLVAENRCSMQDSNSASDITISIVANGIPGVLSLGNAVLNLASLKKYSDSIKQWFSGNPLNLGHHDRLQLYSRDVVASSEGQELLHCLHQLTYATVYASTPQMANAQRWGNWKFDTLVDTWSTRLAPLLGHSNPPSPQSPFNAKLWSISS